MYYIKLLLLIIFKFLWTSFDKVLGSFSIQNCWFIAFTKVKFYFRIFLIYLKNFLLDITNHCFKLYNAYSHSHLSFILFRACAIF